MAKATATRPQARKTRDQYLNRSDRDYYSRRPCDWHSATRSGPCEDPAVVSIVFHGRFVMCREAQVEFDSQP